MDVHPLVITDNDELLSSVLSIAAAAGVDLDHLRTVGSRSHWRSAPAILLDAQLVEAAVLNGMPRRPGVVVVAADEPDGGVWEHCVLLGVERTVVLPQDEDLLIRTLADSVHSGPGGGLVIGLIGARGGAGASVMATAVAVAGADDGSSVVLADCDPWGAGLDLLLGLESDPGLRWTDLAAPAGRVPTEALHSALPSVAGRVRTGGWGRYRTGAGGVLSVLTHDRDPDRALWTPSPESLAAVIDSCRRAGELAVIDLPRAPDPLSDQVVETADLIAIVAPSDVPTCYAARRLVDRLAEFGAPLGLVVRGPSPGGIGPHDLAESLDVPLIVAMRPQPHLARDIDFGRTPGTDPRSPLARAARAVIAAASKAPALRSADRS